MRFKQINLFISFILIILSGFYGAKADAMDVMCTMEYNPVCGEVYENVMCITAPCNSVPVQRTFSNICFLNASNARFLHYGECNSGVAINHPPIITGFSGPSALNKNETGVWTINAYDPDGNTLSYYIDWGEVRILSANASVRNYTQTTTFTHSYSRAGTYTVTITVKDSNGATAVSTITVFVKESVPTLGCYSGGVYYQEGTNLNCINTSGNQECIADAVYVCRAGTWQVEGGYITPTPLPEPTYPDYYWWQPQYYWDWSWYDWIYPSYWW